MSNERVPGVFAFTEALLAGHLDALTSMTKAAYACGADVRDLLTVVEDARTQGDVPPLMADHARSTVCAWQWIADRRRALA